MVDGLDFMRVGLFCVQPDPRMHPKMRQVVHILRLSDDGDEREREGRRHVSDLIGEYKEFLLVGN